MPDVIFEIGADQNRSLPWSLPQNRILTLIRWWGLDGVPNTPAIPTNSASHLSPPGFHADHVGQVTSFPKATLLIGKGDWDVLTGPKLPPAIRRPPGDIVNSEPFMNWISGGGTVEPVLLDKDVFGDSTVMMLNTPGHTPGHHVLLVKLPRTGNVLLSGDLAHFRENYNNNVVTGFNSSRAETLASFDRVKQIAVNLKATFVIQHDPRDVDKLPAFPASAN